MSETIEKVEENAGGRQQAQRGGARNNRGGRGRGGRGRPYSGGNRGETRNNNSVMMADLGEEKELSSRTLEVENKKIVLEVRQNNRGKFMKISEINATGRRNRIILALSCAKEMESSVSKIIEILDKLPPHDPEVVVAQAKDASDNPKATATARVEGRIHTEAIVRESRRYFVDLKENQRGRFMRITMLTAQHRVPILVPCECISPFFVALVELTKEHITDEDIALDKNDLLSQMKPKSFRVDRRQFFFDVGATRRGLYVRISEVRPNYRTAIIVPEHKWKQMTEFVNEYDKTRESFKELNETTNAVEEEKVDAVKNE